MLTCISVRVNIRILLIYTRNPVLLCCVDKAILDSVEADGEYNDLKIFSVEHRLMLHSDF